MVRSRKELSMALSRLQGFANPKRRLEQYPTDPDTASALLWSAHMLGDIYGRAVADLGCGTGILSYGAFLLGARDVICIDIDSDAVYVASRNLGGNAFIHLVVSDVRLLSLRGVDTVVMNPPFGVVRRGADIEFLRVALRIAREAVYTIHKFNEESNAIIVREAVLHGFKPSIIEVRDIAIPAMYERHRRKVHRFRVALYVMKRVRSHVAEQENSDARRTLMRRGRVHAGARNLP